VIKGSIASAELLPLPFNAAESQGVARPRQGREFDNSRITPRSLDSDPSFEEPEDVPEARVLRSTSKGHSWLDDVFSLETLFQDLRIRNPSLKQSESSAPPQVIHRSLEHFVPEYCAPIPNLPLSPAVITWLEEHTRFFNSSSRLGAARRVSLSKGSLPVLSRVDQRFVPSDTPAFSSPLVLPEDWYKFILPTLHLPRPLILGPPRIWVKERRLQVVTCPS